jgi:hypothetical protein
MTGASRAGYSPFIVGAECISSRIAGFEAETAGVLRAVASAATELDVTAQEMGRGG